MFANTTKIMNSNNNNKSTTNSSQTAVRCIKKIPKVINKL